MPGPIVFISHNTVKDGMLEGFRNAFGQVARRWTPRSPGRWCSSRSRRTTGPRSASCTSSPTPTRWVSTEGAGTDGEGRRVHPDQGIRDLGSPSEPVLEAMRRFADAEGVPLHVRSDHVGGYLRLGG